MIEKVIGPSSTHEESKLDTKPTISRQDSTNADDAIVEDIDPVETMLKEAAED